MSSTTENPLLSGRKPMEQLENEGVKSLPPLAPNLEEYWTTINLPSGFQSKTKVIRPKSAATSPKSHPLIVLFFGGGFAIGSPNMMTQPGRELAEEHGAVVLCPSYRLVPDVAWPVPFEDAYDLVAYLSENAEKEFGADLNAGFIVGGVSAGASVGAVAAAISVLGDGGERGKLAALKKPLTGVFCSIALLLVEEIVPKEYRDIWTSREESRNLEGLNTENVEGLVRSLQPNVKSPWFSPINALSTAESSAKQHPPVYIQVGKKDPLRDDGVIFEKVLRDHGVKTKMDLFQQDGHAAWTVLPFPSHSQNPTPKEATLSGMKWLLNTEEMD
jgi:acetyl esterase/lipase